MAFALELSPVRPDLRGSRNTVVALVAEDAAGDALAISAAPSVSDQATASAAADSFRLTLTGAATFTVTARDDLDGSARATFAVTVVAALMQPEPQRSAPAEQQDVVTRYDTDGDGKISLAEYNAANPDLGATLTVADLIKLRAAYVASSR
ncbi:MAG: hypothetical protein OXC31_13685 [Spirochaetaceae bacterium]|nr:hypothetical protein [Spirochaetaceae bacterium]